MTPPRQFPGDFEGDDVWEQLSHAGNAGSSTPKAPLIVGGYYCGGCVVVARHRRVYRWPG